MGDHMLDDVAVSDEEASAVSSDTIPPLAELFQDRNIRILGTTDEPLFCAADVAAHIVDANSTRVFKTYKNGVYIRWAMVGDVRGTRQKTRFLTEAGLYKYLLQSKCSRAETFQIYTYNLLKVERRKIVDSTLLEARIAQTRFESCRQENTTLRETIEARRRADNAAELAVFNKRWGPTREEREVMWSTCIQSDEEDWAEPGESE